MVSADVDHAATMMIIIIIIIYFLTVNLKKLFRQNTIYNPFRLK